MKTNGPGKYDDICTLAREAASAEGAVLMIIKGNLGGGFSIQVPPEMLPNLPKLLETMANEIRKDLA